MCMLTIGIDEVGRGCWAGPLVAGAVVLGQPIAGLRDSKKLSKKRRERLATEIELLAVAHGLGWVEPAEIDRLGLTKSVELAMRRALEAASAVLALNGQLADEIIIDGNINYFPEMPEASAVIKADDTVPAVSAASIIAKVARDNYMATEAHAAHPNYGFDKHVGYGTTLHMIALRNFGVTPLHRKSYKPVRHLMIESDP